MVQTVLRDAARKYYWKRIVERNINTLILLELPSVPSGIGIKIRSIRM